MKTLPLDPAANASPEALLGFLSECQTAARALGRAVLVSISVVVDALDPLAVLESIFEEKEAHFYIEKAAEGVALAGAELVLQHTASGPDRLAACQAFVDDCLARTLAVGAHQHCFGGPLFFTRIAFSDTVEADEPFESAQIFVPRWQVGVSGGTTVATANLLVEPDADLRPSAQRIWKAHAKFHSFSYGGEGSAGGERQGLEGQVPSLAQAQGVSAVQTPAPGGSAKLPTPTVAGTRPTPPVQVEVGCAGAYEASVVKALEAIEAGRFSKIVLARAQDLIAEKPFHPLRALNALRERYADCYAFSVANGRGQSFIGASPERLLKVQDGRLMTEALAGSARRGAGASEDAALGGALLRNEKDLREHRWVADSIARRLRAFGLVPELAEKPVLRRLANIQHLHTPIAAEMPAGVRLLDVLARLHPTPAVGGAPREAAVPAIRGLEAFPRGLYAGALGWLDSRGNGEFCVGLRSALIDGPRTRIYAGAGIVAGSQPAKEFAETELKIRAMREAILEEMKPDAEN